MKHTLPLLLLLSSTLLYAEPVPTSQVNNTLIDAVERVEDARKDAIKALNTMVSRVDQARETSSEYNRSVSTKIIETHAIGMIARSTSDVEIARANAMSLITQAIDKMDPDSINTIANAIASVEIAKAKAAQKIVKATERVEISKTKKHAQIKHPEETLTIAKNVSAIQIAKAAAKAEIAHAVSRIEIARSNWESEQKDPVVTQTPSAPIDLDKIKTQATANISSYLTHIEVTKANMLSKIANEVERVEIAKIRSQKSDKKTLNENSTYPKVLIKKPN